MSPLQVIGTVKIEVSTTTDDTTRASHGNLLGKLGYDIIQYHNPPIRTPHNQDTPLAGHLSCPKQYHLHLPIYM